MVRLPIMEGNNEAASEPTGNPPAQVAQQVGQQSAQKVPDVEAPQAQVRSTTYLEYVLCEVTVSFQSFCKYVAGYLQRFN